MDNNPVNYQPGGNLDIPTDAGPHLNPQDVEVAVEVPGRFSFLVHPGETVTCCVVDRVS